MQRRVVPRLLAPLAALLLSFACRDDGGEANPDESGGTDVGDESSGGTGAPTGDSGSVGEGSESADPTNDGSGDESGVPIDCELPDLTCPAELVELGEAGEMTVDSFEFEWTYDAGCMASVGPVVFAQVPNDATGLAVTVDAGFAVSIIGALEAGGTRFIDLIATGDTGLGRPPFKHGPSIGASVAFPMSTQTSVLPGCVAIWPLADGDLGGQPGAVHLATKRFEAVGQIGLNLVVVDGAEVTDEELASAAQVMHSLYTSGNAAEVQDVEVLTVSLPDGPFIPIEGEPIAQLRSSDVGDDPSRMNLFFVADFTDAPGTLGLAAGVPGPNGIAGTGGSGVVLAIDAHRDRNGTINVQLLGETMAHEVGHQLGLFHTTESDGSDNDLIDDTPACSSADDANRDGMLTADECPDGLNFMFWTAADTAQTQMSAIQSDVIFFSPITR